MRALHAPQDEFACEMFEEIIRYHILCEHELCGSEATVSNHEGFSSHLNVEQMNKVNLLYWMKLYSPCLLLVHALLHHPILSASLSREMTQAHYSGAQMSCCTAALWPVHGERHTDARCPQ